MATHNPEQSAGGTINTSDVTAPVLEVQGVEGGYGHAKILNGVSIKLEEGQIVSVVGPNGAGKSTLMKAIFGLVRVTSGRVFLEGKTITNMQPEALVKLGMAYVPQINNVFPSLSVVENLEMGAYIRKDNYRGRIDEMFTLFPDLRDSRQRPAGQLSGGQRNMLAMARALMLDTRALLLDEPTAGLAPKVTLSVWERILSIRDSGVAVLVVEQNTRMALERSDYGYILVTGHNRFEGLGSELIESKEVANLYLGQ
ncbi:MAG TPA: ABC transporter ATP-binding protein [Ktedonobacteraceae bacterium]|nr:ABC transporter ATP-binding protein [Ktedonobacteraceae bacterium]